MNKHDAIRLPPKERVERVVSYVFNGLHNAPTIRWHNCESSAFFFAELFTSRDLSTFDFDLLTRIVIMAHHYGVRVELSPHMRYIRMLLHPRHTREGDMAERHPKMFEAMKYHAVCHTFDSIPLENEQA